MYRGLPYPNTLRHSRQTYRSILVEGIARGDKQKCHVFAEPSLSSQRTKAQGSEAQARASNANLKAFSVGTARNVGPTKDSRAKDLSISLGKKIQLNTPKHHARKKTIKPRKQTTSLNTIRLGFHVRTQSSTPRGKTRVRHGLQPYRGGVA